MATASWEKEPISLIGVRDRSFSGSPGMTSKTYPCPSVRASSQVSHVPQGVLPPAQFARVPDEVT
jgi:hypothetical protein